MDRENDGSAVMLNASNLSELDLSTIDPRTISSEERKALIGEVIRRAQAERTRLVRDVMKRLWSCSSRLRFPDLKPGAPARTTARRRSAAIWSAAMSTNRRSIKIFLAAAVLGLAVVTPLAFEYRAVAKYIEATQGKQAQSANPGDDLPGLLGNGLAPVLW
jgi:hypothetical protein